jgi:hypothetical protein
MRCARYLLSRGLALSALLAGEVARAGCPTPCTISTEPPVVEPPMTCGSPEAVADSCSCDVSVGIDNTCSATIELVGSEFDTCWPRDASQSSCSSLAPGQQGGLVVVPERTGDTTESFVLRDADGEHRVQVTAHVDEFHNTSCLACTVGGRGGIEGRDWIGMAVAGALVGSIRRSRKMRARPMRLARQP